MLCRPFIYVTTNDLAMAFFELRKHLFAGTAGFLTLRK
jgi:hypothetical protein